MLSGYVRPERRDRKALSAMSTVILQITFAVYLVCAVLFIIQFMAPRKHSRLADMAFCSAVLMHTLAVGARWYEAGRPPFANMFEAMVLFAWSVGAVYLIFNIVYKARLLAVPAIILILLIMCFVMGQDPAIKPLMPALQSPWISTHVITYFIGYAALALACFLSLLLLLVHKRNQSATPIIRTLDALSYRLIGFGFPFLTVGMTTGSAWANVAWGTYWNWDPKETCSLITWFVYAFYLHLRVLRGWNDRKAAYVSVVGFLVTLFTFVGVNYILPGLHSYSG